ncbi:hypothetical protein [Streptomyces sp. NPDC051577]|uniref:hypothetical protein n=1 Tax=Streptomyces sp. NPDC051577 TaxID=3155166 RepID=UPI0034392E70
MDTEHGEKNEPSALLTFLIALPHACPIPPGLVVSRTIPGPPLGWQGMSVKRTEDGPELPEDLRDSMFVSLKFWQLQEPASAGSLHLGVLGRVASAITGIPDPPTDKPEIVSSYRTVVEMVTAQDRTALDADEEGALREAFDRCFGVLTDVTAMTRLVTRDRRPVATKEQVHLAMWFGRRPEQLRYRGGPRGILLLTPPAAPPTEFLDEAGFEHLKAHLWRAWDGSPLELAMDRSLEASLFLRRDGDYGSAVIHAALSSEIVLDSTLALMLWEEQLHTPDIETAARLFGDPRGNLAARVKRDYCPRLGGTWNPNVPGPVRNWAQQLTRLRGRVVYRGYRPTEVEAETALAASDALLEFIKGLLARKSKAYPRTALLVLGEPGLRRIGGWRAAETYLAASEQRSDTWFREFTQWRDQVDIASQ